MDQRPELFAAEKQSFATYERLGGNYRLKAEGFSNTITGRGIGFTVCPERGFVRIVRYPTGYKAAWAWNRFTGHPVYVGKAPKPKTPKPQPFALAAPKPMWARLMRRG